jgi:site-specific DNA-cytosine methylase
MAAGGQLVVSALDRQADAPDDNAAQAGHLIPSSLAGRRPPEDGASGVRRLTPVEAERLMSWPDGWTAVDGTKTPDSRRYAACGDGVVSNVAEWIGRRLVAVDGEA